MPVPDVKTPAKQKPKRGWLRRSLRWLGIAFLFVAIFHRPLFDNGVRFLAIRIAAHEHLNVDLHLSGTIFTNLTVSGIRVSPTGAAPTPVRRIEIDRLHLDYSIPSFLRHGIGQLLKSYEIVNATLDLDALPSKNAPEREEKHAIADTLNTILGQPAFYADRVRIQNFNISVRSQSTLTVVQKFNLTLDPEYPGALDVEKIEIPGLPVWTNLHAETSYVGRNFFIRRLALNPELVLEEFNFDASQHAEDKAGIQLKARVFGGDLAFTLSGKQLNKKGENLEKSYSTLLKLSVSNVSLESAAAYFGAPKPPAAKLTNLNLTFTGEPEKPRTWNGAFAAEVGSIVVGSAKIDKVNVVFQADKGKANLSAANVVAGRNAVSLTARLQLPESVNNFPESDADATLKISAPDLSALTATLPRPVTGTISGGGPLRLHAGKVEADLALDVDKVSSGTIDIASAALRLKADKRISPNPANPLDELNGRILAQLSDLHAQGFAIDSAKLEVENHNDLINLRVLEIFRAENSITAHGSYRIPSDPKNAANSPLDLQFAIHLPRLATFGIAANGHPLSGHLEGGGNLKTVAGKIEGGIEVNGGQFHLANFETGPLAVKVRVADNEAKIQEFSLTLDGGNRIFLTGKAGIQAPFAYDAGLNVDLPDLGKLQPLLAALNVNQTIAGMLRMNWTGKGDSSRGAPAPSLIHSGHLEVDLGKVKANDITLSTANLSGSYDALAPDKPRLWKTNLSLNADTIAIDKIKIDKVTVALDGQDGKARLSAANVTAGKNSVSLTADIGLPESSSAFANSDVDASLQISAPDLRGLSGASSPNVSGSISGGGPIRLHGGKALVELAIVLNKVASGKIGLTSANVEIKADKRISPAPSNPLEELNSHVTAELTGLRVPELTIDSAKLDLQNQNDLVSLRTLEVKRAENSISAQGSYRAPADFKDAIRSPLDAQVTIKAPKIAAFGIAANGHILSGRLEGQIGLKSAGGMLNGGVQIQGGDFRLADFQTGPLSVGITIQNNLAIIDGISWKLRGNDQIAISGRASAQPSFIYDAGLSLDIANLSSLRPLLTAFNVKQALSGALHVDWNGKGDAAPAVPSPVPPAAPNPQEQTVTHSGKLGLALTKGKLDKIDLSEIRISGDYGADFAEFKEITLVSSSLAFNAQLSLRDDTLKVANIQLTQAGTSVLGGELTIPVDLKNSKQPIPFDRPLSVNIRAEKIDLEKLSTCLGKPAATGGTIAASITADGTIHDLAAQIKVSGRSLRAKMSTQLDPAEFDLDLSYGSKKLTLEAGVRQRLIQPLSVKGQAALDLESLIRERALNPEMAVEGSVQLPPTSLAALPKFVAPVRRIDGTAGIDVRLGGTVNKPVLSGAAVIDLKSARMANDDVPELDAFHAKLDFANDVLSFSAFDGVLGGGKFKLGGNIKLAKLTNPVFNLRLESKDVLVKRDDSITVRADTDLTLAGPLNAASAGGTVYVTHSRFFKEIDILPIALPGKSKPAPKSVQSGPMTVSFPNPPLRDWKFDLSVKTRKDDPFLVRGNLANGKAEIDLHLAGTGLAPTLEGAITIPEFHATLPFSSLNISRGFVYFMKDAPFQPSLDLQADSQIRDYLIHAYVYGKATDPQVTLSSEPPLKYSDIVALLATGSTVSEIGSNGDVMASRAAMLAIQELYQKIFHHGQPTDKGAPSLLNRFDLQLGAIDPRTGQQQATSKLKLTDKFYLLGDLGLGGQFSGQLKYLIRFR